MVSYLNAIYGIRIFETETYTLVRKHLIEMEKKNGVYCFQLL